MFAVLEMIVGRLLLLLISFTSLVLAQSPTPTFSSCAPLAAAYYSLAGSQQISSISITGSVSRDGEIDSFAFSTFGTDRSRLEIGGNRLIETRNTSAVIPVGQWQSDSNEIHPMATQNLWVPAGWLLPQSIVSNGLATSFVCILLPQENKNGELLDHVRFYKVLPQKTPAYQSAVSRFSVVDVYVNPATHLPRLAAFNLHPDLDSGADIPIEVWFSDYRLVSGTLSPFHIQAYFNGNVLYDIAVSDIAINTASDINQFELQ